MGSSKKHKEKDRDRERKRDKDRESRKRDKDRHRKRDRDDRGRDSGSESDRKKTRGDDFDDLLEYAMQESRNEGGYEQSSAHPSGGGSGEVSLSIEETNKLRAKLGLKPLQVDSNETKKDETKTSLMDDIHAPAANISEKEQQEKMRRKLEEIREKRQLYKKLEKVRGLGEADDDIDSAASWVKKSRMKEEEKKMAEKRAQMLAEMDEEFGIGDLIEEEFGSRKQGRPAYSSRNLKGITVEHDESSFQEGKTTILTLKDSSILDDEGDTLYNINIGDQDKATKNIELRKKKPAYRPYDEGEYDADGMFKMRGILEKYDEEIDGAQKKSFVLESGGSYDTSRADELQKIQEKLKSEMVSLEMEKPKIASEYYTQEEMVQFKKPKKKKKVRKREMLKADDLESMASSSMGSRDHGSRNVKSILKSEQHTLGDQPYDVEDMEITPLEQDYEDEYYNNQEADNVPLEDDEAQLELEIALQRSRRLKNRKENKAGAEKVVAALSTAIKQESQAENTGSIVIDSTSEFCRTLGEIPTYGSSGNREDEEEDDVEWRMDVEHANSEPHGGWEWVKAQEEKSKQDKEKEGENNVLDDEPVIGSGMAAALQLAAKKGLLEAPGGRKRVEEKFVADLPSVGVIDEEKMSSRGDDKDRFRSSRYGGGSSHGSSRIEKEGYKPDVKLEYVDEKGRLLSPKEAFRYLSHKFHGKTPAKMKTEKRSKKIEELTAMQKMSSVDTPLNTAALLKEKQKEAQSPFLILSGGGKTFSTGASISKGKTR